MSFAIVGCAPENEFIIPDDNTEDPDNKDDEEEPTPNPEPEPGPVTPDYPNTEWAAGELAWVFDMNILAMKSTLISMQKQLKLNKVNFYSA